MMTHDIYLLFLQHVIIHSHRHRNWGARTPQYFALETVLIFMPAAQIATIAVYTTFPPK